MNLLSRLTDPSLFRQQCHINGQWCDAADGATIDVNNPAIDEPLGRVPEAGHNETLTAIGAAHHAFADWRAQTAEHRGEVLYRWYQLMLEHEDDLALLMTLEQGKPLAESKGEIRYAASFLKWFAEESRRSYGETLPGAKANQHIVVIRQPIGVCGIITPWNFPSSMITRKAGAALAAGCTLVAKPASATPFSALALAELAQRAGVPDGVFNVVTGDAQAIANTLTESPQVRKISFTGSTATGRKLMANAAQHIQKLSLELGGNAPVIVFDDADMDKAVKGSLAAKFRNTGQTCVCINRFLVQETIAETFTEKLADAMSSLKLGNGLEDGINQSCLINQAAADKVREHISDALDKGATLVCGEKPGSGKNNFVTPTLMTGITADMKVCQEETFGPLAAIMTFESEQQAITLANNTPFGLAAYFYSQNIHRCWRVAEALESGMIGINETAISNAAAPFGGVKESGLGREGSRHGMEEYQEIKYLCMG